jgi:hypothetical protein
MQEKETGLGRDRDPDLVGQLEAAASLEVLLRQKYLNVSEQLGLIRRRQPPKNDDVSLDDRPQIMGDHGRPKRVAAPPGEKAEYHGRNLGSYRP